MSLWICLLYTSQYSDIIFGDQNEWEIASGVPHIPFEALDADYEIAKEAYLRCV